MTAILLDRPLTDNELRTKIYAGELLLFSVSPTRAELCQFAAKLARDAFAPYNPMYAHREMSVENYLSVLEKLRPEFNHHPECKRMISAILAEVGCELNETFHDLPRLRAVCPSEFLGSHPSFTFPPHRDTWFSAATCQINWWLPVFPVDEANTIAFHPQHWEQPIKNDSYQFNFQERNASGLQRRIDGGVANSSVESSATNDVRRQPDIRFAIPPGSMLVFSGAHLHSTVPNATDLTRISLDFRTINRRDLKFLRGAPNVDSEATGTTIGNFRSAKTGEAFEAELIERELVRTAPPS